MTPARPALGVEGEPLVGSPRPVKRRLSIFPVDSILITSAPSSLSIQTHSGTTAATPNSTTRIPASGSDGAAPLGEGNDRR